jgi:hypothetical protein
MHMKRPPRNCVKELFDLINRIIGFHPCLNAAGIAIYILITNLYPTWHRKVLQTSHVIKNLLLQIISFHLHIEFCLSRNGSNSLHILCG